MARFNQFCRQGVDEDFHRERSVSHANCDRSFHVGLRAITHAPFIAVPFNRTYLATKGGPRTDEFGRVVHQNGAIIPGLFCAVGAGTTLGPNLTWGYICGRTLAEQARGEPPTPLAEEA
ncbi:MAG: FAD-binding protein [Sodalis sp. (in: enterobacteria)]|uniref:FAD-binding protein n=1 Tax=Sodalis sp. (in: enterobacteria) TaxID=1898979 RepID=UPI0039E54B9F